jgi:hypothetical protein
MKVRILKARDFYAGLLFILFGGYAVLGARAYPMGTSNRMGPGYFPALLGGILVLMGLICLGRALWFERQPVESWGLRPLFLVLGSVVLFSLLINKLGLVVAAFGLVLVSSLGGWEFRLREAVILYLILAALSVGVFVYGLKLPFRVWPF